MTRLDDEIKQQAEIADVLGGILLWLLVVATLAVTGTAAGIAYEWLAG